MFCISKRPKKKCSTKLLSQKMYMHFYLQCSMTPALCSWTSQLSQHHSHSSQRTARNTPTIAASLSVLHAEEHCFLYVCICFQLKNWMEISIINYKNKMSRRRPTTLMAKDTPLWISHNSLIDHLITLQGYKQSQSRTIEVRELALKKIEPKQKLRAKITLNAKNMHSVCKGRMFMGHPWCAVDVPIFSLAAVEENG